jgi:hypothetical protein
MSMFSKILLSIVVIIVAYALWPRSGSLDRWTPEKMADAEATAWESIRKGNTLKGAWNYYRIYDFEYRVSPVTALNMARTKASAVNSMLRSPDPVDQERMIPGFVEINTRLRGDVAQNFDPAVAGRSEYAVWVAVSENTGAEALSPVVANQLSALFGQPLPAVEKAAGLRARALHAAFASPVDAVDWGKVRADLTGSWEALHKLVAPSSPSEN